MDSIRGGIDTTTNTKQKEYLELKALQNPTRGGTTTSIENSEELANILNRKMVNREGGNNQRLAIMLGMLTKDKNHPIQANIPSKNRSNFSQVKYKPFLDAPFEISNRCCNEMKKNPAHRYHKETGRNPIIATMASESKLRTQKWLENGCNGFNLTIPTSNPMSFWKEQDVLLYIKQKQIEYDKNLLLCNLVVKNRYAKKLRKKARNYIKKNKRIEICSVYGDIVYDYESTDMVQGQMTISDMQGFEDCELFDAKKPPLKTTGCDRTGCVLCGFGCHLEKEGEGRFERLKETHNGLYNLLDVCENNGVTYRQAIDWTNEHLNLNIRY